mgnify:CR=1 FL=1
MKHWLGWMLVHSIWLISLIVGVTYLGGRTIARAIGSRTRTSILGPVDRALGFGFGALKGLMLRDVVEAATPLKFEGEVRPLAE